MSDFKEFQGKDLDEAIESACDYFNLKRDRLEIEILAGGSSGIFGIMGVKKAKVQARPRAQVNTTDILNGEERTQPKASPKPQAAPKAKQAPKAQPQPKKQKVDPGNALAPEVDLDELDNKINGNVMEPEVDLEALDNAVNGNVDPQKSSPKQSRKPRERKPREKKPREPRARNDRQSREPQAREERPRRERKPRERQPREGAQVEERPRANMEDFDPAVLESATTEIMSELLRPIVGETPLKVTIESDRVKVFIDDEENSGLLIGREGQTLSSLQYLVNRLVSRKMEASVRIQVDTGDYRERQDDKLRQIAQHLAEKASDLGRTQSTKPLSSYHRRVIHLALQENEEVFTRSKGDGPMKRVLIVPKSRKNENRPRR
ncbi:Jag family protein [Pseudodesulfovibrio piezophilus]|uniref:RNA-binding protein KhpB n=1 Tax=Pseudodesulfovibrio piezophilus (strain DSM 21447 / JCM 15486 / C1TLV30) TaxID=1322246 RepID=M1WJX7_PSEP2|nr:protein jag [Pseudodesulfovibrio piezophilus]CCH48656.1 Single-stranded nucleic acid binding R3H domain protein [Pseudodesulfovibrio piezophilus C1TLV30]